MATKTRKRAKNGRFVATSAAAPAKPRKRRKNNPSAAASEGVNPKRRKRRKNPATFTARGVAGAGAGFLAGAVLGAASAGLQKVLDPKLIADPWKMAGMVGGAGLVASVVALGVGAPMLSAGAAGAAGYAVAEPLLGELGSIDDQKARVSAELDRLAQRAAEATAGKGAGNGGMVTRRRILPAPAAVGALPPASAPAASPLQAQRARVWA